MLLILMIFFIIISVIIVILKRNLEAIYVSGMTLNLAIMVTGVFIYIAKKGGLRSEAIDFFYINDPIKTFLQYYLITLDDLGFLMAIGRVLFPMFFLYAAIRYSRKYYEKNWQLLNKFLWILPILSGVGYYPVVFDLFIAGHSIRESLLVFLTFGWIVVYIAIGFYLLVYEAIKIRLKLLQHEFTFIIIFFISITSLYLMYFIQDPIQVYQFYSQHVYWMNDIYYMTSILPLSIYRIIVALNVIFSILGFYSIWRYTNNIFVGDQQQIIIEKKIEAINDGTSMFVHSIKNQLLTNRVLLKRLNKNMMQDEKESSEQTVRQLKEQNENMLKRMEDLYETVKSKAISMIPVHVKSIIEQAVSRTSNKYPSSIIEIDVPGDKVVLADQKYLSEAVYNIILNAYEATEENTSNRKIKISCYDEKRETVIEIRDNGQGIRKSDQKYIIDPYFSYKNSNFNWGMGLYYVNSIVKDHFGSLRYNSEYGKGSVFYILLPKYKFQKK